MPKVTGAGRNAERLAKAYTALDKNDFTSPERMADRHKAPEGQKPLYTKFSSELAADNAAEAGKAHQDPTATYRKVKLKRKDGPVDPWPKKNDPPTQTPPGAPTPEKK